VVGSIADVKKQNQKEERAKEEEQCVLLWIKKGKKKKTRKRRNAPPQLHWLLLSNLSLERKTISKGDIQKKEQKAFVALSQASFASVCLVFVSSRMEGEIVLKKKIHNNS
jgi:hypothetical protein